MSDGFEEIFNANNKFASSFQSSELSGRAARGLAIVTCMDSRIDPLRVVGMSPGDAKILRNAGARVTEDVLRTLVLASHLLNVVRVLVMPHTDCRMARGTEAEVHAAMREISGIDTRSIEIRTVTDQVAALKEDVTRILSYPLLPKLEVMGAIYDVKTGKLEKVI
ncbi:MAG: carbonic anhydrase [Actinobacteria bacterium]|jgi:carbonic anhydrase|nr:carbonic anhydrase [Actinomycetota bacterium]